jgi:hypothetical protein
MATSAQGVRRNEAVKQLQIANRALQELLNKKTLNKTNQSLQVCWFFRFRRHIKEITSQKLQSALASFVANRNAPTTPTRTSTAKKIATEWFWASYPIAQVILQIGITGSQVALRTIGFTEALRRFRSSTPTAYCLEHSWSLAVSRLAKSSNRFIDRVQGIETREGYG